MTIAVLLASAASAQDTVHVRAGAPAWGPSVTLTELFTIGGPPDYVLGGLYFNAVDRSNRFYAFDRQANRLKHYDAEGKLLGTISRDGAGPGEYRGMIGMAVIRDSLVIGYDMSNARLTTYGPDGAFLKSSSITRPLTGMSGILVADTGNCVWLYSRFMPAATPNARPTDLPRTKIQWLRVSADGAIVDSIHEPDLHESTELTLNLATPWRSGINNFVPGGTVWPTPLGGLVYGLGDTYRFGIRLLHGPVRIVERDVPPVPLEGEERAQWQARADFEHDHDARRPTYNIPKNKPAYRSLTVDRDGRIWVSVYAPGVKRDLPPRATPNPAPRLYWYQDNVLDVFDPMGGYLGRVTAPYDYEFVAARNDRVYLRHLGADGEELVTVYRLTGLKR